MQSLRNGTLIGITKDKDGKPMNRFPVKIHGSAKRGVWEYRIGNFQSYKTDNGLIYTRADYEAFNKEISTPF